jgi:hypothetical protein
VKAKSDIGTAAVGRPGSADSAAKAPATTNPAGSAAYAPLSGAAPPPSDLAPPDADRFYADSLRLLKESQIPFLVAGTFAVNCYTGINRATKDLDIFCKAGDFPRILLHFREHDFEKVTVDERWLAKVKQGDCFFDVIFSSTAAVVTISDLWFQESHPAEIYGVPAAHAAHGDDMVQALLQSRHRYDGADIAHLILRQSERIDWKRSSPTWSSIGRCC